MTGTNHALTGALIVTTVPNIIVALPFAFGSHFILDSLPHYGEKAGKLTKLNRNAWIFDAIVVPLIVLSVFFSDNPDRYLVIVGVVLAVSPDFAWLYKLIKDNKFYEKPIKLDNKIEKFHSDIQQHVFRNGIYIEIITTIILGTTFIKYVI